MTKADLIEAIAEKFKEPKKSVTTIVFERKGLGCQEKEMTAQGQF